MPQVVPTAQTYRTAEPPTVDQLLARLAARGYQLAAAQVDVDGGAAGSLDGRTPLVGAAFRLRDPRLGPEPTGVVVRISAQAGADTGGLSEVQATDVGRDANVELATFVIGELAGLLPGLTYKPADSALTPDSAELLIATLPERPRGL